MARPSIHPSEVRLTAFSLVGVSYGPCQRLVCFPLRRLLTPNIPARPKLGALGGRGMGAVSMAIQETNQR